MGTVTPPFRRTSPEFLCRLRHPRTRKGTLIVDGSLLVDVVGIQKRLPFVRKDFTDGEYLRWDTIRGEMEHVPLSKLGDSGLYDLVPELVNPLDKGKLEIQLAPLRKLLLSRVRDVTCDEFATARDLEDLLRESHCYLSFASLCLRWRNLDLLFKRTTCRSADGPLQAITFRTGV
jgi:hypothetical protein